MLAFCAKYVNVAGSRGHNSRQPVAFSVFLQHVYFQYYNVVDRYRHVTFNNVSTWHCAIEFASFDKHFYRFLFLAKVEIFVDDSKKYSKEHEKITCA